MLVNGIYAKINRVSFLGKGETIGNPLSHAILRGALNEYGKNILTTMTIWLDTIAQYEKMGLKSLIIDTTAIPGQEKIQNCTFVSGPD